MTHSFFLISAIFFLWMCFQAVQNGSFFFYLATVVLRLLMGHLHLELIILQLFLLPFYLQAQFNVLFFKPVFLLLHTERLLDFAYQCRLFLQIIMVNSWRYFSYQLFALFYKHLQLYFFQIPFIHSLLHTQYLNIFLMFRLRYRNIIGHWTSNYCIGFVQLVCNILTTFIDNRLNT